jgi:hypothetical protein
MKFMRRLASFLSMLAMIAATLAICITYLAVPSAGDPSLLFLAAVAVMLALMSATLALLLVAILYARRERPAPFAPALLSLVALALAGGYLAAG